MYNFKQSVLESLAIHFIGNKADEQGINISEKLVNTDEDITSLLKKYFLKPFKELVLFNLHTINTKLVCSLKYELVLNHNERK